MQTRAQRLGELRADFEAVTRRLGLSLSELRLALTEVYQARGELKRLREESWHAECSVAPGAFLAAPTPHRVDADDRYWHFADIDAAVRHALLGGKADIANFHSDVR